MAGLRIIEKATCYSMIRLLDAVYKMGVSDAYKVNCEGECMEFIEKTSVSGVFGRVANDYLMDWREWMLTLIAEARRQSLYGPMYRYFMRMKRYGSNYLSVILPVAQEFYNKGLSDYHQRPVVVFMEIFNDKKKVWWTRNGFKNVKTSEYIETMQMMCYDRMRIDEESASKASLKQTYYDIFIKAVSASLYEKEEWYD